MVNDMKVLLFWDFSGHCQLRGRYTGADAAKEPQNLTRT